MTDSIDLDDIDVQDDDEPERNRGDWLWKGDGDPDDEPDAGDPDGESSGADTGLTGADIGDSTPRVPRDTDGKPVGIPKEGGGAGGGSETPGGNATPGVPEAGNEGGVSGPVGAGGDTSSGPHGGDADEMTLAFTYRAAKALVDPAAATTDASQWSDWVGIVGDVPAHVLNKFQREHVIDLDFFNGTGTRPTERLAEIGPSSMFYAERMVLVGLPDEAGMEPEGWEFRPLAEAAEKAGWVLE